MDGKLPIELQFEWPEESSFSLASSSSSSSSWLRRSTAAFSRQLDKSKECFRVAQFATAVFEHCTLWSAQADAESKAQLLELRRVHHKKLCDWLLQHFETTSRVTLNGSYKEQVMIDALQREQKAEEVIAQKSNEPGLSVAACIFAAILALEYCHFQRAVVVVAAGAEVKLCEAESWEDAGAELAQMNRDATSWLLQPFVRLRSDQKQADPDWSLFLTNMSRLACACLFMYKPESQDVLFNFIENTCSMWCSVKSALSALTDRLTSFEADPVSRRNFQAHLKSYMQYAPDESLTRDYLHLVCAHALSLSARERYLRIRGSLGEITRTERFRPEEEPLLGIARETLTPSDMRQLLRDVSEKDPATIFEDPDHLYRPLLELQIFSDSLRDGKDPVPFLEQYYISPMQWWQRLHWIQSSDRPCIVALAHHLCVCARGQKWVVSTMTDAIVLICALTDMAGHLVSKEDKARIKKMRRSQPSLSSSSSSSLAAAPPPSLPRASASRRHRRHRSSSSSSSSSSSPSSDSVRRAAHSQSRQA